MRPFSLLVKPASGDCNLRCHYCFYLQTCRLYPEAKTHRMSDTVLERVIHSYVGCSLDGPAHLHNQYRTTLDGKSTHHQVLSGIQTLQRHHVPFNILTLVNQTNVHQAVEIYQYLKKMGFQYHQYIPCVEFDPGGKSLPFAITGSEWGRFLCSLFDAWYPKDVFSVSVRNFDTILSQKTGRTDSVCTLSDNCCHYFVVEYNGDVYPCDFFVGPLFKLGNIMENSWEQMMEGNAYQEFGAQKSQWNDTCSACNYLELCAGDCPKNRTLSGNPLSHPSWLCQGWKDFFHHTTPAFDSLVQQIQKPRNRGNAKSGRTDP